MHAGKIYSQFFLCGKKFSILILLLTRGLLNEHWRNWMSTHISDLENFEKEKEKGRKIVKHSERKFDVRVVWFFITY